MCSVISTFQLVITLTAVILVTIFWYFAHIFWLVTGMASRSCWTYECFLFKSSTGRFKYFINTSTYCKYQTLLGYFAFKDARALTFLLKYFELIVIAIILNIFFQFKFVNLFFFVKFVVLISSLLTCHAEIPYCYAPYVSISIYQ